MSALKLNNAFDNSIGLSDLSNLELQGTNGGG